MYVKVFLPHDAIIAMLAQYMLSLCVCPSVSLSEVGVANISL